MRKPIPAPVLLVLALALIPGISLAGSHTSKISITTNPPAMISIDGKKIRRSPLKKYPVKPGTRSIEYKSKKIGSSFSFAISVKSGEHVSCSYDFPTGNSSCRREKIKEAMAKGKVDLLSKPSGAKVLIDGVEVGKTPLKNHRIPVGRRAFEFQYPNHESHSEHVDVGEGQHIKIEVELASQKK